MPTLSANTSAAVSLPAGYALYATGAYGTMQVAPPYQTPLVNITPVGASVGPFPFAVTVNLTASGQGVSYQVGTSSPSVFGPALEFTWATRPAANSVPVGTEIIVTDVAANGGRARFYSDSTYWRLYAPLRVAASGVAIPYTGINGDTNLVNYTLPGGLLTPNGKLDIRASISTTAFTSGINGLRYLFGGTQTHVFAPTVALNQFIGVAGEIRNRNAQNSQIASPINKAQPYDTGVNAFTTATKDTSTDQVVAINQVSSATGTNGNLEYYEIVVMS